MYSVRYAVNSCYDYNIKVEVQIGMVPKLVWRMTRPWLISKILKAVVRSTSVSTGVMGHIPICKVSYGNCMLLMQNACRGDNEV